MKAGQVTQPIPVKNGGYRILKLLAKEAAGERQFSDVQVQQAIRDALRTRKEQLLRSAYLVEARDEAHVTELSRAADPGFGRKASHRELESPRF